MHNQRLALRRRVHRHGEERSQMSRCQLVVVGLAGIPGTNAHPRPSPGAKQKAPV